jgi:hypothetical protein
VGSSRNSLKANIYLITDSAPTTQAAAPNPVTPPSTKAASKWDQIRAVNSRTINNSSWDTLRQNHERERVANSSNTGDDPEQIRGDDRAAEQARFDALLEKERNIK